MARKRIKPSAKTRAGLRLRLLGGLHAEWDGKPVVLESNKNAALLVYLAVTRAPQTRAKLAGLFWCDWDEAQARHYLSRALWDIARRIPTQPPVLIPTPQTVAFNPQSPHWIDVEEFERIADLSRAALSNLQSAIALCRGDFLDGVFLNDCPEFETWMTTQRARLRELAIDALTRLLADSIAQGRAGYPAGIAYARRLLDLEPWHEESHRQLMLLLARTGQRSAALAQYETCRRALTNELKVTPSPETTRLYERIRAAEAAPAPRLPPQPTPFLGRERELAEIARLLAHPSCRLLTLVGPGGVGKTRLALEAAAQSATEFLHGVHWVPLGAVSSPEFLLSAIADSIKFTCPGRQDAKVQLLECLREKEMLLLLDGFEHLLLSPGGGGEQGGVNALAEMLEGAPDLKLLVTSRARLNSRWEQVFEVKGLGYPDF
jgi:DNA-binding SARP family transcriptional activator